MESIELRNTKNNLDCIILWNYIKQNPSCNMRDLELKFKNNNWKESRSYNGAYCSNLVYCIYKMKKLGIIETSITRDKDGKYEFSTIKIAKNLTIKPATLTKCIICDNKVNKSRSSIYKNICESCTNSNRGRNHAIDGVVERYQRNKKEFCCICGLDYSVRGRYGCCESIKCLSIKYVIDDVKLTIGDNGLNYIRKAILGKECIICGYSKIINYHHVVFKENGGEDNLSNMLPLCPNHHCEVHQLRLDVSEYHKKLLKRLEDIKNGSIEIGYIAEENA